MLKSGNFAVMGLPARPVPDTHEKDLMQQFPNLPASFPLTSAQQDIWLDQLRMGDSPLYNIGGYVDFEGAVVPELIQRAVEQLVARHDALRTQLHNDDHGLPRQTFAPALVTEVAQHDFCALPDPHAASQALMQAHMARPYQREARHCSIFSWSSSPTTTTGSVPRPIM